MLESPATAGGDTLVSSSVQAFKALSPRFRKRLEGLTAIHSNNDGVSQELKNGTGAVMRRQELTAEHSVVRVHPVTGEKALCKCQRYHDFEIAVTDGSQISTRSTPSALLASTKKSQTTYLAFCFNISLKGPIFSAVYVTKLAQSSYGTNE